MSKEARAAATAPPDEDSTPHSHPTIRLHSTSTNTKVAMTDYTENNALDTHQYPPRRRSLLLSDSEISVLDLGPSLEFEGEEGTLRLREGKLGQRDYRGEDGKWGPGSLAVPGRQVSVEESGAAGGVGGAAVRIISSPLLSPLRTTKKGNTVKVRGRESNADKGVEGKSASS